MSVYFIREDVPDGRIKIGTTSRDPHARRAALQTGNPRPLVLIAVIPGGEAEERALHDRFAAQREGGEWFLATPELITFAEALCWVHKLPEPSHNSAVPDDYVSLFGLSEAHVESLSLWMRGRMLHERASHIVETCTSSYVYLPIITKISEWAAKEIQFLLLAISDVLNEANGALPLEQLKDDHRVLCEIMRLAGLNEEQFVLSWRKQPMLDVVAMVVSAHEPVSYQMLRGLALRHGDGDVADFEQALSTLLAEQKIEKVDDVPTYTSFIPH